MYAGPNRIAPASRRKQPANAPRAGFSLIELVIVIVIVGILAALAIPRLSRGSAGASDAALVGSLAILRNAIEVYKAEHGGKHPTVALIGDQLTRYTDVHGDVSAARDPTHIYGPYLRRIPPLPVGTRKGSTGIAATDAENVGWIYNEARGTIRANTGETELTVTGERIRDF